MKYLLALALFSCTTSVQAEVDVATLYDVLTAESTKRIGVSDEGHVVIAIRTRDGAHVSDEAPLKIDLTSSKLKLTKSTVVLADSVSSAESKSQAGPKFDIPFRANATGKATVEVKMSFFICTEKLCAKQAKTLSIPVEVI